MSLYLAFLGTGTCSATSRNPASLALSNGEEVVCIDFGGGAYHALARLSHPLFNPRNISAVFLTHFHVDHVSGLPDFFWGEMWDPVDRRERPIILAGPPGLGNFYEQRLLPFMGDYPVPFGVKLVELKDGEGIKCPVGLMRSRRLEHGEFSTGYALEGDDFSLAVTGDTGNCEALALLLKSCDCAVMEWSIAGFESAPQHISSADIVGLLQREALPPRVFITHIYLPGGLGFDELVSRHRKTVEDFPVEFLFPLDGEVFQLRV